MQISYFLMTSKNIDSDHVCHVIVKKLFLFVHVIVMYE